MVCRCCVPSCRSESSSKNLSSITFRGISRRGRGDDSLSLIIGMRRMMRQLPQTHPKKILRLFLGTPGKAPKIRNFPNSGSACGGLNNPPASLRSAPSRAVETALSSPQSQHVRRCVPRGLTARLASPLPTHLLHICAGALKCPEQWGIPKLESGQSPTGALPRKRFLAPYTGRAIMRSTKFGKSLLRRGAEGRAEEKAGRGLTECVICANIRARNKS